MGGHGPRLADEKLFERMTVIDAEPGLPILASNDDDWRTLGTWPFFSNTAGDHILKALVNDIFLMGVDSVRREM